MDGLITMKNYFLFATALAAFAVASCNKGYDPAEFEKGDKLVSFKVKHLVCEVDNPSTRITDNVSGTTHTIKWTDGDQISMIAFDQPDAVGTSSAEHVNNFSSNYFTASVVGDEATFTGKVPDLYGNPFTSYGTAKIFAVYPAAELTVEATSSGSNYYKITGTEIASIQDGSGWPYCTFTSNNGLINKGNRAWSTSPSGFYLAHAVMKFKVSSSQPITGITITTDGARGLCGPSMLYSCFKALQPGGSTIKTLTLDNGGTFANDTDILFACREPQKNNVLTFAFTSGTGTATKKRTMDRAIAQKVYDLGTVTLTDSDFK